MLHIFHAYNQTMPFLLKTQVISRLQQTFLNLAGTIFIYEKNTSPFAGACAM